MEFSGAGYQMSGGRRTDGPQVAKGVRAEALLGDISLANGSDIEGMDYGVARYCLQNAVDVQSYFLIAR